MDTNPIFVFALVSAGLIACAGAPPRPASLEVARADAPSPSRSGIAIAPEVQARCAIHEPVQVPKFGFDEARVEAHHHLVLDQLADCLREGPLKGARVRLIGRADPRGEHEYNLALGHARAHHVNAYLKQKGVPAEAMNVTTRGELDAAGEDEEGWALDRRVDIALD